MREKATLKKPPAGGLGGYGKQNGLNGPCWEDFLDRCNRGFYKSTTQLSRVKHKMGFYAMSEDYRLRIEIKNSKPVELVDLTNSFYGAADEYKRYMEAAYGELGKEDVTLYVQEIKTGSIITDLICMSPTLPPVLAYLSDVNTVVQFGTYLKNGYDFLLGRVTAKPNFAKVNYENLSKFIEPIAKDTASQLNVNTVINGNPTLVFHLSSLDANAAQNAAKREIGMLNEPVTGYHRNVVLHWYQAKNDITSKTGDRVIIESISNSPVKVIFESDQEKTQMLFGSKNPFTSAYLVDVNVETVGGRPMLYKILNVHERIDIPPQTSLEL